MSAALAVNTRSGIGDCDSIGTSSTSLMQPISSAKRSHWRTASGVGSPIWGDIHGLIA